MRKREIIIWFRSRERWGKERKLYRGKNSWYKCVIERVCVFVRERVREREEREKGKKVLESEICIVRARGRVNAIRYMEKERVREIKRKEKDSRKERK